MIYIRICESNLSVIYVRYASQRRLAGNRTLTYRMVRISSNLGGGIISSTERTREILRDIGRRRERERVSEREVERERERVGEREREREKERERVRERWRE